MAKLLDHLPELAGEEAIYIGKMLSELDDDTARQFAHAYRARRKDPQTVLLFALLGFLGVAGINRFVLGQIGMGILFILTAGLCLIGTIVDAINHKDHAFEYNRKVALEVRNLI